MSFCRISKGVATSDVYTVYAQLELLGQTPCFVLWSQIIEACAMVSVLVLPKAFKVDVSLDVLRSSGNLMFEHSF